MQESSFLIFLFVFSSDRITGGVLKDLNRDDYQCNIADLEQWRENLLKAIDQGYAEDQNGQKILLDDTKGIDVLGNMMEASILSPNPKIYGSLHNKGHLLISVKIILYMF